MLDQYPVVVQLDVRWGDMDAFEHVNNIVYLQYFEAARIAYFDKLGFRSVQKVGPILASTECRYKLPLTYPDTLSVGARVTDLKADRFTQQYAVYSHTHQRVAADGHGIIVTYDYRQNRKAGVPDAVRHRISELEKRLFPGPAAEPGGV